MENEEQFSSDPNENAKIENEFLKLKMSAQFGGNFFSGKNDLPPEVENSFLKSVLAFEENHAKAEYVTVYERINKPDFKLISELNSDSEISIALDELISLLEQNDIRVDFCDAPYPDEVIYKFITEELLMQEIEKENDFGTSVFIYEEFHPNHKADIEKNAKDFLKYWADRDLDGLGHLLAPGMVTPQNSIVPKIQLASTLTHFFESYQKFSDLDYVIGEVSFELSEDETGMGHAEGFLVYTATLENAETIIIKGPFKLYLSLSYGY